MRSWVLGLALLVPLLSPMAAAQQQPYVVVSLAPPSENVMPLGAPITIPVQVTTDCSATAAPNGIEVRYAITRQPAWAMSTLSPTSDHRDVSSCAGGSIVFHATLTVSASDRAPAFMPDTIEVQASRMGGPADGGATGRSSAPIIAGFYSVLDVQAPLTQQGAAPREIVSFPVKLTNLGNANTKVTFEKIEADEGAVPAVPPPVILGSASVDANEPTLVNVQAYRVAGVSGTQSFTLRYQAAYVLDPKLLGASGTLTFRLVPRAASNETAPEPPAGVEKLAPGPSLGLAMVPLGLAALVWRRRR